MAPLLSERTKLIYLNFPSNPTGGVASEEQLQEIADVILKRCGQNVRVYSDEVYEHILFDGSQHHSIVSCPGMDEDHHPGRAAPPRVSPGRAAGSAGPSSPPRKRPTCPGT